MSNIVNADGSVLDAYVGASDIINLSTINPWKRTDDEVKQLVKLTQKIAYFTNCPRSLHHELCRVMTFKGYRKDSVVFRQGEVGSHFYIVLAGYVIVDVRREGPPVFDENGDLESDLLFEGRLEAGQSFGELALINNAPRKATILAPEGAQFLMIEKKDYEMTLKVMQFYDYRDKRDFLASMPLLEDMSPEAMEDLIQHMKQTYYTEDHVVARVGEASSKFIFLVTGEIRAFRHDFGEKPKWDEIRAMHKEERPAWIYTGGELIGADDSMDYKPRPWTLVTTMETLTYEVSVHEAKRIFQTIPVLLQRLLAQGRRVTTLTTLPDVRTEQTVTAIMNYTQHLSFVKKMSEDIRRAVCGRAIFQRYAANEHALTQGTEGKGLFICMKGTFHVVFKVAGAPDGKFVIHPGVAFGERSIMKGILCDSTVTTDNAPEAMVLPVNEYKSLLLHWRLGQLQKRVNFMGSVPVFAHLPTMVLDKLCAYMYKKKVTRGNVIVHEGAPATELYIVRKGECKVQKDYHTAGGLHANCVEMCILGPRGIFGAYSIIHNLPFGETMLAVSDTVTVYVVRKADLTVRCNAGENLIRLQDAAALEIRWRQSQMMRALRLKNLMRHKAQCKTLGQMPPQPQRPTRRELLGPSCDWERNALSMARINGCSDLVEDIPPLLEPLFDPNAPQRSPPTTPKTALTPQEIKDVSLPSQANKMGAVLSPRALREADTWSGPSRSRPASAHPKVSSNGTTIGIGVVTNKPWTSWAQHDRHAVPSGEFDNMSEENEGQTIDSDATSCDGNSNKTAFGFSSRVSIPTHADHAGRLESRPRLRSANVRAATRRGPRPLSGTLGLREPQRESALSSQPLASLRVGLAPDINVHHNGMPDHLARSRLITRMDTDAKTAQRPIVRPKSAMSILASATASSSMKGVPNLTGTSSTSARAMALATAGIVPTKSVQASDQQRSVGAPRATGTNRKNNVHGKGRPKSAVRRGYAGLSDSVNNTSPTRPLRSGALPVAPPNLWGHLGEHHQLPYRLDAFAALPRADWEARQQAKLGSSKLPGSEGGGGGRRSKRHDGKVLGTNWFDKSTMAGMKEYMKRLDHVTCSDVQSGVEWESASVAHAAVAPFSERH